MTMVKYGFGAWAVLGWMVLTGFGFVRAKSYELFVAQHIAAAATLLWLLYMHVPSYAMYNVYLSIAFVVLDWGMRIGWNVMRNMHFLGRSIGRAPGYSARLEPLSGDMVRLSIDEVDFGWKAGQHMYLSIPSLRPFELHPFTIANVPGSQPGKPKALSFVIKAHRGFSKSLHQAAVKGLETGRTRRAFLSGPWGMPPDLLHYETVVLVATSSGASFTTPLLEELVRKRGCVRKVTMHWIMRSVPDYAWYSEALDHLVALATESDFSLRVVVHVTRSAAAAAAHGAVVETSPSEAPLTTTMSPSSKSLHPKADVRSTNAGSDLSSLSSFEDEKAAVASPWDALPPASFTMHHAGRPTVESLIRPPVEAACGETAVVVCGGLALTAQARTFVARLSDERATHKGSGAPGIFLFTESYGCAPAPFRLSVRSVLQQPLSFPSGPRRAHRASGDEEKVLLPGWLAGWPVKHDSDFLLSLGSGRGGKGNVMRAFGGGTKIQRGTWVGVVGGLQSGRWGGSMAFWRRAEQVKQRLELEVG
nr:ferric/cupric reductase transmembrane component 2 [Quercus suber]